MKGKRIYNVATFILVFGGIFFKLAHWSGGNLILIISAVVLVFGALFIAFPDNIESGVPPSINYVLLASGILALLGAVVKIMGWYGGDQIILFTYGFGLVLPFLLLLVRDTYKVSRQYFFNYLMMMWLVLALIRHNPIAQFLVHSEKEASVTEAAVEMPAATTQISTDRER